MHEIQENEAAQLLSRQLRCADTCHWQLLPGRFKQCRTGAGLVDEQGQRTELIVELQYRDDPKHKGKVYVFSVFKRNPYGLERVYQLDVNQTHEPRQDDHGRPYEHLGNRRLAGPDEWRSWRYDELLSYFCARTNISFQVAPLDPAHLPRRKK